MPYVRAWIHYVWSTKNRAKLITKDIRPKLLDHIKTNARNKDIYIDEINCVHDHIHILISLGKEQTISKLAMLLKGESSHWMNKNKIGRTKFEWQDEYYAVSVSESGVDNVRKYIRDQEEHHREKLFSKEVKEFLNEHDHNF